MNKSLHRGFKILIIISSGLGVFLNIFQSGISFYSLTYFTNQSNLLVFVIYFIYLFYENRYKQPLILILYQAVVAIVLTGIVYHVMLRPVLSGSSFASDGIINLLVHTVTPLLVVVERVIFSKKNVIQRKQPLYWLSFPMLYFIFTIIYSRLGGVFNKGTEYVSDYPYFFLNFQENGIGYFLVVIALILLIGYSIYFLNRKALWGRKV